VLNKRWACLNSPVGTLLLQEADGRLVGLIIIAPDDPVPALEIAHSPLLTRATSQLEEYFAGRRKVFDLPLGTTAVTGFSRRVVQALCAVAYGETLTYGELATRAGAPRAARAVGQVMAANPVPIIIPCHRVLAAGDLPGGYSGGGGLQTKQWLLNFERAQSSREKRNPVKVSGFSELSA
jgi:methylated-DNA-[protein]-cysteine S-methyltransferase